MLDSHLSRPPVLRPGSALASKLVRATPISVCLLVIMFTWLGPNLIPPAQSLLQLAQPAAWMSQVASLTGQAPKLGSAPLVQLDTSSKYYKTMIDGMMNNFKLAVSKASERPSNNKNLTSLAEVAITSNKLSAGLATCSQLQVEGIERPRVSSVRLNKSNMTLQVSFIYKNLRVQGKCQLPGFQTALVSSDDKPLLEAHYWNVTWTASVMPMIGREHFDLRKVASGHRQQKLSLSGLKEAPKGVQQRLQASLVERLEKSIESRMVEIMETVMMERGMSSSEAKLSTERGPLAKRHLKRNKRQTPCSPGEELDDYVDQLFRFGTRIVRAMEPITLPNATIELPDYNLKIFLYEGRGTRAYKFRRAKSAWVFCSNETISLGLTIEVEELRVAYKYRVISGNRLVFDGDLEAKLSPKVQAQFSQAVQEEDSEEPVMQRVDRLRVFRLGRVHVLIRGLGNLTQSLSMLINSYLNDNQEELQPTFRMVEGDAVKMINKMLANVNVPLLSVV